MKSKVLSYRYQELFRAFIYLLQNTASDRVLVHDIVLELNKD